MRLAGLTRHLLGTSPDAGEIEAAIDRIYALQSFVNVGYERVRRDDGSAGLRFAVREKNWGPNYLNFGLTIQSDIDVDTEFGLHIGHRRRNINRLGAQWLNDLQIGSQFALKSEFYQPLDYQERLFVAPYLEASERNQNIFQGDRRVAQYEIFEARSGVDFGFNTATTQWRLGIWRGFQQSTPKIASAEFPTFDVDEGALRLLVEHDSLDRKLFATSGHFGYAAANLFRGALGSDGDYERLDFSGYMRFPLGDDSAWHLGASGAWLSDDALPTAFVTLGGVNDLSGFPEDSLIGRRAVSVNAGVVSGITKLEVPVIGAPRIIGFVHAGDVWDSSRSVDLDEFRFGATTGIAVDVLGAILFAGTGYTDGGDVRYYLRIGTGF